MSVEAQKSPGPLKPEQADYLQRKNHRSLYYLSPGGVKNSMRAVPRALLYQDEIVLQKEVAPTPTMKLLRFRYWEEYLRASEMEEITKIDVDRICEGICNPHFFEEKVFKSHYMTAWMMCPPKRYFDAMEEALAMGVERLREVLELSLYKLDSEGKRAVDKEGHQIVDHRSAGLILKAYLMVDQRQKGGFLQKQVSATFSSSVRDIAGVKEDLSMEQIEAKIREIKPSDIDVDMPVIDTEGVRVQGEDKF